jgi:hypothetical protein
MVANVSMLPGNQLPLAADSIDELHTHARGESWTAPVPVLPFSQYLPGYISEPKKTLGAAAGSWASMHTHTSFHAAIRAVEDEESTSCVAAVVVHPERTSAITHKPITATPNRTRILMMRSSITLLDVRAVATTALANLVGESELKLLVVGRVI